MSVPRSPAVFSVIVLLSVILLAVTARAQQECLNEADKAKFMEMYNDVVSRSQGGVTQDPEAILAKVEEIKAFLLARGCSAELEEAEKRAQQILKGTKNPNTPK